MNAPFRIEIGFLILIFNNGLIQFSHHIFMAVKHGGEGQGGGRVGMEDPFPLHELILAYPHIQLAYPNGHFCLTNDQNFSS